MSLFPTKKKHQKKLIRHLKKLGYDKRIQNWIQVSKMSLFFKNDELVADSFHWTYSTFYQKKIPIQKLSPEDYPGNNWKDLLLFNF